MTGLRYAAWGTTLRLHSHTGCNHTRKGLSCSADHGNTELLQHEARQQFHVSLHTLRSTVNRSCALLRNGCC